MSTSVSRGADERAYESMAMFVCVSCGETQDRSIPVMQPDDDFDTRAWRLNDLWPLCCGQDLRLLGRGAPTP